MKALLGSNLTFTDWARSEPDNRNVTLVGEKYAHFFRAADARGLVWNDKLCLVVDLTTKQSEDDFKKGLPRDESDEKHLLPGHRIIYYYYFFI